MSAEQGEVDQKPSMEHGYLGPIFDVRSIFLPVKLSLSLNHSICINNSFMLQNAEALSLAEAYDYMRGLVEVQSKHELHVCMFATHSSTCPPGTNTEVFKKAFNHVRNFGKSQGP